MADHSKSSLVKKLGIKPGDKLLLVNIPENYDSLIDQWPDEIVLISEEEGEEIDFIHFFTQDMAELEIKFPNLKKKLRKGGGFWVSWPKSRSKLQKDLNGNDVRRIGFETGLVDVKVCAVDEGWSGIKFMYRLKDR